MMTPLLCVALGADGSICADTGCGTHRGTSDLLLYANIRGVWTSPNELSKPGSYEIMANYGQVLPVEAERTFF